MRRVVAVELVRRGADKAAAMGAVAHATTVSMRAVGCAADARQFDLIRCAVVCVREAGVSGRQLRAATAMPCRTEQSK
jgi:hypothetical protein